MICQTTALKVNIELQLSNVYNCSEINVSHQHPSNNTLYSIV